MAFLRACFYGFSRQTEHKTANNETRSLKLSGAYVALIMPQLATPHFILLIFEWFFRQMTCHMVHNNMYVCVCIHDSRIYYFLTLKVTFLILVHLPSPIR